MIQLAHSALPLLRIPQIAIRRTRAVGVVGLVTGAIDFGVGIALIATGSVASAMLAMVNSSARQRG